MANTQTPPENGVIELRGVRTHNLRGVHLDLPLRRWIAVCGVSGAGKSSLAFDTLYAEGQRRYLDSLSLEAREFIDALPRPEAESIRGLPAAVAIRSASGRPGPRPTVGSATELLSYLQLLFTYVARGGCPHCGLAVQADTPESVGAAVEGLPPETRLLIAFQPPGERLSLEACAARYRPLGFARGLADGRLVELAPGPHLAAPAEGCWIVVDRLVTGRLDPLRVRESIAAAFEFGEGRGEIFVRGTHPFHGSALPHVVDGDPWTRWPLRSSLECRQCGQQLAPPTPQLFDWSHARGACPRCEGLGDVARYDPQRIVPDPTRSIRQGAIAPWNTPAYAHELQELLAVAGKVGLSVDRPFAELTPGEVERIWRGVPQHDFGGLDGFFAWLERRAYKTHHRVFLSRWRRHDPCPACGGQRLRPEALAWRVADRDFAQVCAMEVDELVAFCQGVDVEPALRTALHTVSASLQRRLRFLQQVGLGHLTLGRRLRTLSDGELQRVTLTVALGSDLVDMLYVLDEPSRGLHPHDVAQLRRSIAALRDRGNTVLAVDHSPELVAAADFAVEVGPRAGSEGGRIIFAGPMPQMMQPGASLTGEYLAGRRGVGVPETRRAARGRLRLRGATGHNLRAIDVEFPLEVLCAVTGLSGAGKSTLVRQTLYPAVAAALGSAASTPLPFESLDGCEGLDAVVLVDSEPAARSPRSNPATYVKAFDAIRALFADTRDAKAQGLTASHFSFNVDGGRCSRCAGEGSLTVDLQFMEPLRMVCDECQGRRYRPEILAVRYRERSIADVLAMTVREAFAFFHGHRKLLKQLQPLLDVGLDYLQLGQPLAILSSGESQRLRLAAHLATVSRGKTLLILEEPARGLHPEDVTRLVDVFHALLAVGHSLIVVEHQPALLRFADWIIDLGPGAAARGGQVIAAGTPEAIAGHPPSLTGQSLRPLLEANR